ncbi:progestin and adipoQ receptor family member IIIa [Capsaspora owczarzaki ATCC 30864]|uniref:Progestin and adipoQ receptor family member IIIa n=1 Tax=Capsaspora owczarzaki (strain ATCC 30864) TaxID=595528 RepID=A0A0D2VVA5_CAPO3|nr:progestin and adipoQ receptor family member IIIa [Capsaspora owczarzaki ATCC 30864]KJE95397.1 progestin and adipoQ receptor family member IIIa [Capsaspora owczarzaki ATCC 30864]|eukprot:XP_004345441.1 progestin and adipoQ receptor family member IIIa [Capsaspora owczarzaki ATCC 30864]
MASLHPNSVLLHKYSEIPPFLQGNPHIKDGYRVFLSYPMCLRSLCVLSNEFVNVWSHLVGFLLFVGLFLQDQASVIETSGGDATDRMVISTGLACFQICMIFSASFHLFHCHSEDACRRWLRLDLLGISVAVCGCYFTGIYYGFYCLDYFRNMYFALCSVLTLATVSFQLHPNFDTPHWFERRLALYAAIVMFGIVPTMHWAIIYGGEAGEVQLFLPKVVIMYLLFLIGVIFYITRFPERSFPGMVDIFGSSHQWWHVFVLAALLYWHNAGLEVFAYRKTMPCVQPGG